MPNFSLAIIGAGPMATYAMERLAALLPPLAGSCRIVVHVFEASGRFGDGAVHSADQPATSLMNRIACQIALGADETNVPPDELLPLALRPTFYEWCARKLAATGERRFALAPTDMPARKLHGEALSEQFAVYREVLQAAGVKVAVHAETAAAVEPTPHGFIVVTATARREADHILIVTGHGIAPPPPVAGTRLVEAAYPLEHMLDAARILPGQSVAVDGMGLTAIDVILHLTEGRGGCFVRDGGQLTYRPSGREPGAIIPFGPTGHFVHCRPHNSKAGDLSREHNGVFFSQAAVAALRKTTRSTTQSAAGPSSQLDFESDILPLVVLEMAYVYYRALLGTEWADTLRQAATPAWVKFLQAPPQTGGADACDALIAPLQACFDAHVAADTSFVDDKFDWQAALVPLPPDRAISGDAWRDAVISFMERDLVEARRGNLNSPIKAACDGVWRDLRTVFCAVADDGGLTPASHRKFQSTYLRIYNRLSNGAGGSSLEKILALVRSGQVDVTIGPEPRVKSSPAGIQVSGGRSGVTRGADLLIRGRIRPFDAAGEPGTLYGSLLDQGLIRRWTTPGPVEAAFTPGALDLDTSFHPRNTGGQVESRLTFLGAPAEGARFFQTSAARPNCGNYILNIVAAWARELRGAIAERIERFQPAEGGQ
jgi:hypothetical protein